MNNTKILRLLFTLFVIIYCEGCAMAKVELINNVPIETRFWYRELGKDWTESKKNLKEEVQNYIDSHPFLDAEVKNNLSQLQVTLGMNKQQVVTLWGKPFRIRKWKVDDNITGEIWQYYGGGVLHSEHRFYFKDDSLIKIERISNLKESGVFNYNEPGENFKE